MAHIGIDIGTSNTLVALVNDSGKPETLKLEDSKMTPSVLFLEEEGGYLSVGQVARDMWKDPAYNPRNGFRRWKLNMGENHIIHKMRFGGPSSDETLITPEYLTTRMVEHVLKKATEGLGGVELESVLVTVPHGWRREHPEKCRATREAAAQAVVAGQNVRVQNITVSEPVAAAAYWMWASGEGRGMEAFSGQTVLVCDVGGGTFDLSLIKVGGVQSFLDVIDAANSNYAGDYVDALLCAQVCDQFNTTCGTNYPVNPEAVLEALDVSGQEWLREWFCESQANKQTLSEHVRNCILTKRDVTGVKPVTRNFTDRDGNHQQRSLDLAVYMNCLEPFYEEGRRLLKLFLERTKCRPDAVVFAGGGSKIWGVQEHVVEPVFRDFLGEAQMRKALGRIQINARIIDEAIALGAALIANKMVEVQERLLHDVGIVVCIPAVLAKQLGFAERSQHVIVTDIISKGSILPISVESKSLLGSNFSVNPGDTLTLRIIIDDDSQEPWVQTWELAHPGGGQKQSLDWTVAADTDGALTVTLRPATGQTASVEGKLQREHTGSASLCIDIGEQSGDIPRISVEQLKCAIKKIR